MVAAMRCTSDSAVGLAVGILHSLFGCDSWMGAVASTVGRWSSPTVT